MIKNYMLMRKLGIMVLLFSAALITASDCRNTVARNLTIVKATYGVKNGKKIDVTGRVRGLLSSDRQTLNIPGGAGVYNTLFGDPHGGKVKELVIHIQADGPIIGGIGKDHVLRINQSVGKQPIALLIAIVAR